MSSDYYKWKKIVNQTDFEYKNEVEKEHNDKMKRLKDKLNRHQRKIKELKEMIKSMKEKLNACEDDEIFEEEEAENDVNDVNNVPSTLSYPDRRYTSKLDKNLLIKRYMSLREQYNGLTNNYERAILIKIVRGLPDFKEYFKRMNDITIKTRNALTTWQYMFGDFKIPKPMTEDEVSITCHIDGDKQYKLYIYTFN